MYLPKAWEHANIQGKIISHTFSNTVTVT